VLLLLLPISLPVWHLLPKLRFLQYPWRWVLVVEAPMAFFFAAAVWPKRASRHLRTIVITACCIAFLASTFFAAKTFLRVCQEGDTVADLLDSYRGGGGLEGTDEYEPPDTDHWKIAAGLPDACFVRDSDVTLGVADADGAVPEWKTEQHSCEATAIAQTREPEHMRIAMTAPHEGFVILKLASFPAWHVQVNGKPAELADPRDDGLIAVAVPQGPVTLTADWAITADVIAGRLVSGSALLLLVGVGWLERRHSARRV